MTVLTRWEPVREFSGLQDRLNRMNRLFRESFSPESPEEALTTTSFAPPVDIYEDEHTISLKMEVPGIDEQTFLDAAESAKKNCPVSQALAGVDIKLNATFVKSAAA